MDLNGSGAKKISWTKVCILKNNFFFNNMKKEIRQYRTAVSVGVYAQVQEWRCHDM